MSITIILLLDIKHYFLASKLIFKLIALAHGTKFFLPVLHSAHYINSNYMYIYIYALYLQFCVYYFYNTTGHCITQTYH